MSTARTRLSDNTVITSVVDRLSTGVTELVKADSRGDPMDDAPFGILDIELFQRPESARRPFRDDQRVAGLIRMVPVMSLWVERRGGCPRGHRMRLDCFPCVPGTGLGRPGGALHQGDAFAIADLAVTEEACRIGRNVGRGCRSIAKRRGAIAGAI
jgi:hypothetical protein